MRRAWLPCGGAAKPGTSGPTARPPTAGASTGPSASTKVSPPWPHRTGGATSARTDSNLSAARFGWCGNFQGGRCAVRELDGGYLHVTPEGKPAYDARWRYAGDFRDGAAVVQSGDGRSTHIDPRGEPVHGVRFLDLDVFHKGRARARDEDGWMHIDETGRSVYARRFAAVEPFYNGQARVERFDGGLEVIDEAGRRVVELRPALRSEFAALSDDMTGFWRTQAICAAVELGVFEALPATAGEVARSRGLDPVRTRRLLRALAELRLVAEVDGEWRATGRGGYLEAGHPRTLADAAREYGRIFPRRWETLSEAVRGAGWTPPDLFGDVAADPDRTTAHHRMLASYALHDYPAVPAALDLRGEEHVIDAGGGYGTLAGLLADEYPELRITVLDRPEVVGLAARREPGSRVRLRSTDLFGALGNRGGRGGDGPRPPRLGRRPGPSASPSRASRAAVRGPALRGGDGDAREWSGRQPVRPASADGHRRQGADGRRVRRAPRRGGVRLRRRSAGPRPPFHRRGGGAMSGIEGWIPAFRATRDTRIRSGRP